MASVCGRCCQLKDAEIEIQHSVKATSAPGFQGTLDSAFGTDVPTPKPTAADELAAPPAANLEEEDEPLPPAPMQAPEPIVQPPAAEASKPTTSTSPSEFKSTIDKGERKLGIDINYHDNTTLLVTKVHEGPVLDHNNTHPAERLLPGDRILELNGIKGNAQHMLASCKGATELQVVVRTAAERTSYFEPSGGQPLGIVAEPCDKVGLLVTRVEKGVASEKGAKEGLEFALHAEDRIIGINDIKLDAAALLQELSSATSWKITWRRVETKAA